MAKSQSKKLVSEKLSKELLGLAGEYAVASELCRRGLYSQLTLGNHKRTDILIESNTKMIRISVKAKQGKEWLTGKEIFRDDDFLILVDFQNKNLNDSLYFYIINKSYWSVMIKDEVERKKDRIEKVENDVIHFKNGYKGMNVQVKHVLDYKDKWNLITSIVRPKETITETEK